LPLATADQTRKQLLLTWSLAPGPGYPHSQHQTCGVASLEDLGQLVNNR